MHFNLFATSMLISVATALDLEASTEATAIKVHPQKGIQPNADGTVKSIYHSPDDNCCVLYHGDKFTEKNEDPICWDLATGTPLYD